jgi:hypothetical protein
VVIRPLCSLGSIPAQLCDMIFSQVKEAHGDDLSDSVYHDTGERTLAYSSPT